MTNTSLQDKMEMLEHLEKLMILTHKLFGKKADEEVFPEQHKTESDVMNIIECSEYLGIKVNSIRKKTCAKTIPHYKHNGRLFFKRSEIDAWRTDAKNKVETLEEIEAKASTYILTRNKKRRK